MLLINFVTQDLTQNILVKPTKWCAQLEERGTDKDSSVFNQISDCVNYQYIKKNLYCINKILFDTYPYDKNFIQENLNIIDSAMNWTTLLIKKGVVHKL